MTFSLFGKPKRRRRRSSSSGGLFGGGSSRGGSGGDTALTIVAIAGVGVVGYFVFMGSDTIKQFLKNAVDAGNSTGNWLGGGSYWLQNLLGVGDTPAGRNEEDSVIENLGGHITGPIAKDIAGTKRDIKARKDKYAHDWTPWVDAIGSTREAILGLGCGVIRKC